MKYLLILIITLSSNFVFGQFYGNSDTKIFRSSGDAILRIQPDQVVLSLGVESRGKELIQTKEKNYKIQNDAISYCKSQGIPDKYIQTDFVRINPHYSYGNDVIIDYYSVVQSVSIIIEDLEKYEQILTDLLNIGVNKVNNIEFRTTNLKENRYKVRKMAIKAAKEKADFLTSEIGIKLGKIINIGETVNNPTNSFSRSNYANISQNIVQSNTGGIENSTLAIGMLSLKATVNLTYEIEE